MKIRRFCFWVSFICSALLVAGPPAQAADAAFLGPAHHVVFDIPSQPLAAALYAYSAAAAIEVVADGILISGRRSAALKGVFTPEDALRNLLAGTGLIARRTAGDAFVLLPGTTAAVLDPPALPDHADYSALIQAAMKRTLCRFAATQPGAYRIAVQLWIEPSGTVAKADLLESTGNHERDKTLSTVLHGLPIGEPPPASLPQPVTLVILPRPPTQTGDCRSANAD